ncbi:tetratricopeptide repeat protein [Aquimarina sp. MMG016]|uniref:tetratricopeptide repeat protein n=1 Tax=Aquimarina sp. MMG016 TaxID=2822690 RepID=UPI001B39D52D|nr:tetratricopeptide repeat protein [Aquimarina sp. MMG016]MBQ4820682.1 tetratricopeptide repeat protein [Aquimarina sp. MMG016]
MKQTILVLFLGLSLFSFSQEQDTTLVRLINNVQKATTDSLKIEAYLTLNSQLLLRDFTKVEYNIDSIVTLLAKNHGYDKRLQQAIVYQQLGVLNRKMDRYTLSLDNYLKAKEIFESIPDSSHLSTNYHNIAQVYRFEKEYEKAIEYFRKSIVLKKKLGRIRSLGTTYNILGVVYTKRRQRDSAFYYYDKAEEIFLKLGYKEGHYQVVGNKAFEYVIAKQYKKALPFQLENLAFADSIKKYESVVTIHYSLADIYRNLKQYDNALYHIETSLQLSKEKKMGNRIALNYKKRSHIYHDQKDFEKALRDYRRFFKVYDTVFNLQKAKEIRELELRNQFRQEKLTDSLAFAKQKALIAKELEKEKATTIRNFIIIGILLILGVSLYMYNRKRLQLEKIQREHLEEELEETEKKVETREEEISTLITESIQQIQTKKRLVEDLKKISDKENSDITLKSVIAELKADDLEDSKLLMIRSNLEALNFEFYKQVKSIHPNLTPTDLEICSYVKLDLSGKEIAKLRNTSIDAVKKARHRLKKKLELSENEDLDTYILSLKR